MNDVISVLAVLLNHQLISLTQRVKERQRQIRYIPYLTEIIHNRKCWKFTDLRYNRLNAYRILNDGQLSRLPHDYELLSIRATDHQFVDIDWS